MNLPKPTQGYDAQDQSATRRAIEQEDKRNLKRGEILDGFLMRDTVTGAVVTVTIVSGSFVIA